MEGIPEVDYLTTIENEKVSQSPAFYSIIGLSPLSRRKRKLKKLQRWFLHI